MYCECRPLQRLSPRAKFGSGFGELINLCEAGSQHVQNVQYLGGSRAANSNSARIYNNKCACNVSSDGRPRDLPVEPLLCTNPSVGKQQSNHRPPRDVEQTPRASEKTNVDWGTIAETPCLPPPEIPGFAPRVLPTGPAHGRLLCDRVSLAILSSYVPLSLKVSNPWKNSICSPEHRQMEGSYSSVPLFVVVGIKQTFKRSSLQTHISDH